MQGLRRCGRQLFAHGSFAHFLEPSFANVQTKMEQSSQKRAAAGDTAARTNGVHAERPQREKASGGGRRIAKRINGACAERSLRRKIRVAEEQTRTPKIEWRWEANNRTNGACADRSQDGKASGGGRHNTQKQRCSRGALAGQSRKIRVEEEQLHSPSVVWHWKSLAHLLCCWQ